LSDPGTLQRIAVSREDVHIIPDPLLHKYREECREKAEGECHEPKRIYTNIGCVWVERWEWWRRSRRDRNLWSDGSELLRDLGKYSGMLFEVIHHFVRGVDFKVRFAVNHERCEGGRK